MEVNKIAGILSIVLGLIFMIFPIFSTALVSVFIGLSLIFLGIAAILINFSTVNIIIKDIKNLPEGTTTLNVEPILFGLLFVLVDMLILSIKNVSIKVYKKMKNIN